MSFAIGNQDQVGLLLSGGIDSSVVAFEASQHFNTRRKQQTVIAACATDGATNSTADCRFASLLAKDLYFPLSFEDGMSTTFESVDKYFETTGQPPNDMFYPMQLQLLRNLADRGSKVVLCGEGGESSVTSYADGWMAELLGSGRWFSLFRQLFRSGNLASANRLLREAVLPYTDRIATWTLRHPKCFLSCESLHKNHFLKADFVEHVWQDIKAEIECAIDYRDRFYPLRPCSVARNDRLNLGLIPQAHFYSGNTVDVELRCPLLDPDVIESIVFANPAMRRDGGERRLVALKCYAKRLPSQIVERKCKSPFFPSYERWLISQLPKIESNLAVPSSLFEFNNTGCSDDFPVLHRMHRAAVAARFAIWAEAECSHLR